MKNIFQQNTVSAIVFELSYNGFTQHENLKVGFAQLCNELQVCKCFS